MSDALMRALAHEGTVDRVLGVVRVPSPTAGAQFAFALPNDRIWRIRGVSALLTTSGVAGNRLPALTFDDQASVVAAAASNVATAATLAVTYSWNPGGQVSSTAAAGGVVSNKLPELVLPGGYEIKSVCSAFDVGDQWSSVRVWAETLAHFPMGVHEYRDAIELAERVMSSPFLGGLLQ